MDVKSGYLQRRGFNRDSLVQAPREKDNGLRLLSSNVPAYGLINYVRFSYLTSNEVLTQKYEFKQSSYERSLCLFREGYSMLLLTVHIDDYLYAGSPVLAATFEELLHEQFHIR